MDVSRLDLTLKRLQERVREQELTLERLRASASPFDVAPSLDPKSHLQQLRVLKLAYESVASEGLHLPSLDSPLPALLALRSTDACLKGMLQCKSETEVQLATTTQSLKHEQTHLKDAELIQAGLESRIRSLRQDIKERTQRSSRETAKDMIREMRGRKTRYDVQVGELVRALNGFIDGHLAPMLAAEELGGPVVGGLLDIDEDTLEAGFNTQGKAKRPKNNSNEDKRQRRIDEIWGPRPIEDGEPEEPWDERRAAAAEMRELTESLFNSLVEAGEGRSEAYVELPRECAAARFLIRSKVAQYHFNDARRLRLINFDKDIN